MVDSYWVVGLSASALLPVPRLIAIQAVLWVINTLHDPCRVPTTCQNPVSCLPAPVSCQPSPMAIGEPTVPYMLVPRGIGEPYTPTVDNCTIYAHCSGPCSHAKVIYCGSYHVHSSSSSVGHSHPVPGSHSHGPYGPSSYFTYFCWSSQSYGLSVIHHLMVMSSRVWT